MLKINKIKIKEGLNIYRVSDKEFKIYRKVRKILEQNQEILMDISENTIENKKN